MWRAAGGLNRPRGVEVDRNGRIFCLLSGNGQIVEVDRDTGAVTRTGVGTAPGGRDLVLFDATDGDGDELLDSWEGQQGYALCDLPPASDFDSDGASAFREKLFNRSAARGESEPGGIARAPGAVATVFTAETLADEAYAYRLLVCRRSGGLACRGDRAGTRPGRERLTDADLCGKSGRGGIRLGGAAFREDRGAPSRALIRRGGGGRERRRRNHGFPDPCRPGGRP